MEPLTLLAAIMSIIASGIAIVAAALTLRDRRKPKRKGRGRHRK